MANYNVTAKVIRGAQGSIESAITTYLNGIDNTKVIRAVSLARYGADQLIVLIIHDT